MLLDLVAPAMQSITYVMLLIVLIVYYLKAFRQPQLRRFWLLFALASTMSLLANIAWIIHFNVTQSALSRISAIDLFYVTSYILVGIALWTYPTALSRRVWLWMAGAMSLALLAVTAVYFGDAAAREKGTLVNFIIYAAYPIFDAGQITLAWMRYGSVRGTRWEKLALLLACGITSYGLANAVELTGYVSAPILGGFLQNLFWMLRHVFVLMAALSVRTPADVLEE